eukprot:g6149.t1
MRRSCAGPIVWLAPKHGRRVRFIGLKTVRADDAARGACEFRQHPRRVEVSSSRRAHAFFGGSWGRVTFPEGADAGEPATQALGLVRPPESDSILLTFEAFSVTSLPDEPQRAATLPRPRTASANFASRGQLLMDSGKQRMQLKQNFDKTLVRIFYDSELLTNAWLQDFVAGWLAQKKLAQEAKKDRR